MLGHPTQPIPKEKCSCSVSIYQIEKLQIVEIIAFEEEKKKKAKKRAYLRKRAKVKQKTGIESYKTNFWTPAG